MSGASWPARADLPVCGSSEWDHAAGGSRAACQCRLRSAGACHDGEMQEIEIAGDVIRLGQLLKLSALADSGADARELLLAGGVSVNGAPEARRGRQLHRGDLVEVGDQTVRVA